MATANNRESNMEEKALKFIQEAIEADRAEEYVRALNLYKTACGHFLHVIKFSKNKEKVNWEL